MNQKQLLETIGAMKLEIVEILYATNLTKDKDAQRTLLTIDSMFDRLDIAVEDVIPKESLHAYFNGVDEATKQLNKVGISPIGGLGASITSGGKVRSSFNNQVHLNAIAEVTDNLMLDFKAAIRTAKQNTYFTLKTTLGDVKEELQKGIIRGDARTIITQKVAESFVKDGMTAFVTIDDRRLPLDFYAETVTRTNLKIAHTKGAAERYRENGMDLFTVTGNTPTCHQCAPLRGIVFTLNPNRTDYTYLDPKDIIRHPNCQCSMSVWVESYKTDAEILRAQHESLAFNEDKDTRSKSQKAAYERQQSLNRKSNAEKKQFMEWNATLGAENYKTLGAFRRAKRSNSVRFQELQSEFRSRRLIKSIK